MKLSHRDLRNVISAIEILNGDVKPITLPERTLRAVMSLIPNEITSFDGFGTDGNYSGYLWYSPAGTVSEERVRILGELVHNHPIFKAIVVNKIQATQKITDYLSIKKFHDTALYSEFYKHIGGDSQMMTAFTVSPKLYITCSLHRTQMDFTERDLAVLEILSPHLIAAFRNAQFIHNLAAEREPFINILDNIGYGIITLDAELRILVHNFKAIKFLHEYFPPSDALPVELADYIRSCNFFSSSEIYTPPAVLTNKKTGRDS